MLSRVEPMHDRRADARQVRGRLAAFTLDFEHGVQRAVARRTTGAEGDREKTRFEQRHAGPRGAQFFGARAFAAETARG